MGNAGQLAGTALPPSGAALGADIDVVQTFLGHASVGYHDRLPGTPGTRTSAEAVAAQFVATGGEADRLRTRPT